MSLLLCVHLLIRAASISSPEWEENRKSSGKASLRAAELRTLYLTYRNGPTLTQAALRTIDFMLWGPFPAYELLIKGTSYLPQMPLKCPVRALSPSPSYYAKQAAYRL